MRKNQRFWLCAILCAGLLLQGGGSALASNDEAVVPATTQHAVTEQGDAAAQKTEAPAAEGATQETIAPVVDVAAKSAILMEAGSGRVLYEKNPDEQLNPASVTKTMTMLLIMEALDGGKITYDDTVTTSARAASMGGSQIWLEEGETMTVRDMLKAIAIVSANDCAVAMAEHLAGSVEAFVAQMNERAKALGCQNTTFVNPTGLEDPGHATTARDLALISRELLKHPDIQKFSLTWMDSLRDGKSELTNTNKLIKTYPGITGLKTGSTSTALYCLSATATRDNMSLIAVVLASPTTADRFADAARLLDFGYANYTAVQGTCPAIENINVLRGKADSVAVRPVEQTYSTVVEKGAAGEVKPMVEVAKDLAAPIIEGQRVGKVDYMLGDQVLYSCDVVAAAAVDRMGYWDLFFNLFSKVALCK